MKYLLISVLVVVILGLVYLAFFRKPDEQRNTDQNTMPQIQKFSDKLIIKDIKIGTGPAAQNSDILSVNYIGTLSNGEKFDSSYDRGQPFSFTLGHGQVIQGWEMGITGMKVGGKRKLTIPYQLAYGETGQGPIPPKTTLIFEVELLSIQ